MLLRDKLKCATAAAHEALEQRLGLTSELSTDRYARYLNGMLGFYRVLAPGLGSARRTWGFVSDAETRIAWLEDDLRCLGASTATREPAASQRLRLEDPPAAAGCSYVLEGATLGGRVLYTRLSASLGIAQHRGGSFLFGHGAQTAAKWKRFVGALNALDYDEPAERRCVGAACRTFAALDDWYAHHGWSVATA